MQAEQKQPQQIGKTLKQKADKLKSKSEFLACHKCGRKYKHKQSLNRHLKTCTGTNGNNGGARPGSGRPKGSEDDKSADLRRLKGEMRYGIALRVNELITTQFAIALGAAELYRREVIKDGKKSRVDVSRVYDQVEYMIYLSLPHDELGRAKKDNVEYYYKAGTPNWMALTNLLDRAFGKPKENIEVGEDPEAPLPEGGTGTTTELKKLLRDVLLKATMAPVPDKEAKANEPATDK